MSRVSVCNNYLHGVSFKLFNYPLEFYLTFGTECCEICSYSATYYTNIPAVFDYQLLKQLGGISSLISNFIADC